MEGQLKVGFSAKTGMVSKKKPSSKQKKSNRESSKGPPAKEPESGGEHGAQLEEEHGLVDDTSPSLKIVKSGSDKEEEEEDEEEEAKEVPVENKKSGPNVVEDSSVSGKPPSGNVPVAKSGKGKRLKSEIDVLKVESPSLISSGSAGARQLRPRKQPAVFREVGKGEVNDDFLASIIGKKIQVYWPLDKEWYSGQVRSFDARTNRHLVVYDDSQQERLDLKKERIRIPDESGNVSGETAEVRAALPESDQDIDTKESKEGSNKNSVKSKEGDIVDGGKKSGVKRKQGKKNDRKRKEEEEETAGKKVEMEAEIMSTDVDDSKKKNEEEDEENVNKIILEKEDKGQEQVAEEVHNHKRPKKSKQTAPRSKRGGSGKQIAKEHVVEDRTEGADGKQESKEQSHHTMQDIKPDDVKATDHKTLEDVSAAEVDSAANNEGEMQQKAKESGKFPKKKADGSATGSPDKLADSDDEVAAKRLSKDAGKQPKQIEKFDEKNASTVATEQHIDDQKPVEKQILEQADEEELTIDSGDRLKITNQMEEKRIDARGGDGKLTEKKTETKDTDQVSKKHTNKKHHGRMKARDHGKK